MQSPPKRRIQPIRVDPAAYQHVVSPAKPAAGNHAAEGSQVVAQPGRRMHVDLTKDSVVSFQELLKQNNVRKTRQPATGKHEASGTGADHALPPAFASIQRSGKDMGADDRRGNTFANMIRTLEIRCLAGELSDVEEGGGSSDDSESEDSEESDDEKGERDLEEEGEEEGEGEESGSSSAGEGEQEGEAEGGDAGNEADSSCDSDSEGAEETEEDKPRKLRAPASTHYEPDFIDDTDIIRVRRGTTRTVQDGFFINRGDVATVEVPGEAPRRRAPAARPARAPTPPQPAEGPQPAQPAAAARVSEVEAGPSNANKRARGQDAQEEGGARKAKQRKVGLAKAAPAEQPASRAPVDVPAPATHGATAVALVAPVRLSVAQMAAQAGQAAGSIKATGAASTSQPSQAPDAPPGPETSIISGSFKPSNGRSTAPTDTPAPAATTAAAPARRARSKSKPSAVLDKLKAKLAAALPQPGAAAPKPLKFSNIRAQVATLALACYSDHVPVDAESGLEAEEGWRERAEAMAQELLSEGRGAALTQMDAPGLAGEMVKVVQEHCTELNKLKEAAVEHMKHATPGPDGVPVLSPAGCAAVARLMELARKLAPTRAVAERALRDLVAAQREGAQGFTVSSLESQASAHVLAAKQPRAGAGTQEAGEAGAGSEGTTLPSPAPAQRPAQAYVAALQARLGSPTPQPPPLAAPPAAAAGGDGRREEMRAVMARVAGASRTGSASDISVAAPAAEKPAQGRAAGPSQAKQQTGTAAGAAGNQPDTTAAAAVVAGAGGKAALSEDKEAQLLQTGVSEALKHGADEALLRQDWLKLSQSVHRAVLTALCFFGSEGASTRMVSDTIFSQGLLTGWASGPKSSERVHKALQTKAMQAVVETVQAQGPTRYAWRHLPNIVVVPRKKPAAAGRDKSAGVDGDSPEPTGEGDQNKAGPGAATQAAQEDSGTQSG